MSKENYGVHITHCCYIHGCKYGDKDCPVASGEVAQKYTCYYCDEEDVPYTIEEIELLRKTKSYRLTYEQLKNQISDLEAKLAESEKEINEWIAVRDDKNNVINKQTEKINQLKQQLEKSEEKLEEYKGRYLTTESYNTFMSNEIHKVVKENTELKQKLAESEKKYEDRKRFCISETRSQTELINYLLEENEELKQQFAEKEKEKEKEYKESVEKILSSRDKFILEYNQDKISFAVEQLEKVKEIINKNYFYNMSSDSCTFDKLEVDFQINNQIASLKKGSGVV